MPRSREQVDRIEPVLKRRTGVLKGRPGTWVDVPAAQLAGVGGSLGQPVILSRLDAFRIQAFPDAPETQVHQMVQASIVVREALEKLPDCELGGHLCTLWKQ